MNENHPYPMGSALICSEPAVEEPANLPARLLHYQNARVTIHYVNTVSDTGTLVYLDRSWAELLKDNGERLLVPMQAIRLLKLVKSADTNADATMLLRAADGAAPEHNTGKK